MPAIAALTLFDGETTPVERTFSPDGQEGNLSAYADRVTNGDIDAGNGIITLSLAKPSKTSKLKKVRAKLVCPIMDTVLTSSVHHTLSADVVFLLPTTSSLQERKNLRVLFANLMIDAVMEALVDNGEPVY